MAAPLVSRVELFVSAKHLPQKDLLSASDPFVRLLVCGPDGAWHVIDQTEWINNNANPTFAKRFGMDFRSVNTGTQWADCGCDSGCGSWGAAARAGMAGSDATAGIADRSFPPACHTPCHRQPV